MKGNDPNQNRKKETNSTVFVPDAGIPLEIPPDTPDSAYWDVRNWTKHTDRTLTSRQLFQIERIIRYTQVPPIQACTPYQMQAIAARLKTGQSAPQIPKDDRLTTGNEM